MNISDRIKKLSENKGVTMYVVSQETGISQSTLSRFITGKGNISRRSLKILSDYFQVSTEWLLTGDGVPYLDSTTERTKLSARTRIIQYVVSKGMTIKEFAKSIGSSIEYWCDSDNDYTIPIHVINKALKKNPELNPIWVFTGEGEMLSPPISSDIHVTELDKSLYPSKPFIDSAYAMCGLPAGFNLAVKADECDKVSLPLMIDYDFSIRGKGDSMLNFDNPEHSIKAGDFIACKIWTSRTHLRWGEVYTLATRDGVVVKKIMPSEKEGHIKCVSFNERNGYLPYDLSIEEINDWAIVVGIVSVNKWN